MTSEEKDRQAYEFYHNRAIKLQATLVTGILNTESREVLKKQIMNDNDNAWRFKKQLNAHGFEVDE